MSGYAKRNVRLAFPDLTEEGDPEVFVTIRNPKIVPAHLLVAREVSDDDYKADRYAYFKASYGVIASLIVDWNVYDATSLDMDPPRLGLPATEETVAKLPRDIAQAIADKIQEATSPGAGA